MKPVSRRRVLKTAAAGLAPLWLGACNQTTPADNKAARPLERIEGFSGRIIENADAAYESWRKGMVWQMRKPERFPEMIVRPRAAKDVAAVMRFASRNGMKVSIRSGGHHIWGASLRDEGVLIDLSEFKQVQIDESNGVASVGPSLWSRDIMTALAESKRAFPVAHCATVSMGGYLLGGGLGINGDEWGGMACNNIVGATLVTADGEVVKVAENSHEDLMWALRGGGGALPGVVTELDLKTFERPQQVFSSTYVFPLAMLDLALELLDGIVNMKPRNTELLALMLHNPQAPADAPPEMQKVVAVRVQTFADSLDDAKLTLDAIAALSAARQSVFSLPSMVESYEDLFASSMDWRQGFGFGRFAVENAWTNSRREAVREIATEFVTAPSWKSHVVIQPKLVRGVDGSGAFSMDANTYIGIYSVWDDGENDDRNVAWLRGMSSRLDRHAAGHYINEIDARHDSNRLQNCYNEDSWTRLRDIRGHWDPDHVFHDFPGMS